jgi:hypothetical protein
LLILGLGNALVNGWMRGIFEQSTLKSCANGCLFERRRSMGPDVFIAPVTLRCG